MSFDNLTLDILEEFAERSQSTYGGITFAERKGYGLINNPDEDLKRSAEWRKSNPARAVANTRRWEKEQLANSFTALEFRTKRSNRRRTNQARLKAADPERVKARQREWALAREARRAAVKGPRRPIETQRTKLASEWASKQSGELSAGHVVTAFHVTVENAWVILRTLLRLGVVLRVRTGVYMSRSAGLEFDRPYRPALQPTHAQQA